MEVGRNKKRFNRLHALEDTTTAGTKRGKPPYSYISLIVMAILESPNRRQTLSGIIEHIQKRFPYYGENCPAKGWKNSIRHNLSLNDCFEKTCRDPANPSKGHFWRLHPRSTHMFEGGSFMRRKKRFRKDFNDDQEGNQESRLVPHNDELSMKAFPGVNLMPYVEQEESLPRSHSNVIIMPSRPDTLTSGGDDATTTNNVHAAVPCSILAGGLNQNDLFQLQHFQMQTAPNLDDLRQSAQCREGRRRFLLSSFSSNPFCLVCAGCTCYY